MFTYDDVAFGPDGQCPDPQCGMTDGEHGPGCPEKRIHRELES